MDGAFEILLLLAHSCGNQRRTPWLLIMYPATGNRNRSVQIEAAAAVHSPRAGENERKAIGRVRVRGAHVAWVLFHKHKVRRGLVQPAVEHRHLTAVRCATLCPTAPLDRVTRSRTN
jgi:hypothetical protein